MSSSGTPDAKPTFGRAEIEDWLVTEIAKRLHVPPEDIDPTEPFARYGLNSREAINLSGALECWLDRKLPLTVAWDYPTIEALVNFLAGSGADG